jgi:hypothetical protein
MFAALSLALEGETALIGTNHEGLLLWRLGTRELRQAVVPADAPHGGDAR